MKCNVGKFERVLRIIVGLIILGLGYNYKNVFGLIGLIPLLTGIIGFCPAYLILKRDKEKIDSKKENKEEKFEDKKELKKTEKKSKKGKN
ncbi:MAG: DUF2892 domain-containing protein [Candidatus Woesearchaeota archaeon]